MSEDRRCGTCKWVKPARTPAPTQPTVFVDSDVAVYCVFPMIPDAYFGSGDGLPASMDVSDGATCRCWEPAPPKPAHEEDGA